MTPEERAKHWAEKERWGHPDWVKEVVPEIVEMIREFVAAEREACAKIAEIRKVESSQPGGRLEAEHIEWMIRSRKEREDA